MHPFSIDLAGDLRQKFTEGWPYSSRPSATQPRLRPKNLTTTAKTNKVCLTELQARSCWDMLETSLVSMIYGSNYIESAGTGPKATANICRALFDGKEDINVEIDESDPLYQEHVDHLQATGRRPVDWYIIQSRREVLSHAKALSYMVSQIIVHNAPWSEGLILATHKILHCDLEGEDSHVVPGQYRTHEVAVSYTNPQTTKRKITRCMRASVVPAYMANLLSNLTDELAPPQGPSDPHILAARYAHHFVMIHPFSDGNGRMSRIILNTLLLQFSGQVAVLGVGEGEKGLYLDVVGRGAKVYRREDMEVGFWEQVSHLEFARFVSGRAEKCLMYDEALN